jgi:hypothetical protein
MMLPRFAPLSAASLPWICQRYHLRTLSPPEQKPRLWNEVTLKTTAESGVIMASFELIHFPVTPPFNTSRW